MSELTVPKPRAITWQKYLERFFPYLLILPVIIYFIVFWLRPVITLVFQSFTAVDGGFTLENYYMVLTALLIKRKFYGSGMFLFLAMIPMAIPAVAVGAIWITGLTAHGWINSLLYYLGIIGLDEKIYWLAAGQAALLAIIIIIDAWQVIPSVMIILLAGLQNIPPETEEAGYVFGGNYFYVLRKITVPLLKPTITTAIILRLISAIQIWLIIVMLLGFSRMPVLVERIVYYAEEVDNLYVSAQMAAGYTIIVSFIVSLAAIAFLFVSGAFKSDEAEAKL
jgi:multiple sugar transport system permease protein